MLIVNIFFTHGIPEAILKMLARENDADGCWVQL